MDSTSKIRIGTLFSGFLDVYSGPIERQRRDEWWYHVVVVEKNSDFFHQKGYFQSI